MNNMNGKRVLMVLLICIALLAVSGQAMAASKSVAWTVDQIGTFNVPKEWQAVELGEVLELIEKDKAMMSAGKAALAIPGGKLNPMAALKAANMNIYNLTMNNGKAYYSSVLFLMKDPKPMVEAEQQFFGAEVTAEQREQLEKMIKDLSDMAVKELGEVKQNRTGLTMLKLTPVEYFKIGGKQAYGEGMRIVPTVYGLTVPLYAKGYVFNAQGSLAFAVLVTSDAERTFWDPVIGKVVRSYR